MKEIIYKQNAIDALGEEPEVWYADDEYSIGARDQWRMSKAQIDALPSAERKGKWIMHLDDLFPAESTQECSQCHHEQPLTIDNNYCPNCGARMVSEDDT